MAISAKAWTLPDEVLGRSTHPGLNRLIEFAGESGMSMVGSIDPYDDTRFNRLQMQLVIPELRQLSEVAPGSAADAARELLLIAELVSEKPHRYLEFVGD